MKKKLLFIVPIFPKHMEDDTIVPFIFQFSLYFTNYYKDIDVDIISVRYPKSKPYNIDKLSIFPIGVGFNKKNITVWALLKTILKGLHLFRKNKYDGILSFWYGETALSGKILGFIFKTKHFVWMQGQDVKLNNKYLKLTPFKPKNLIVVGRNHQRLLKKYWGINSEIVANVSVNPNSFPKLNTNKRPIDIIGVGNLSDLKNYSFFIDIIFELQKTFKNINVIICGNGEEMEKLSEKIERLKLNKNIKLLGYVSNKKIKKLMNESKLLLHTSKFEGNSLVIQEALYSGCQVISTIPLLEKIENFYFTNKKSDIIKQTNTLLNNSSQPIHRVRFFKIEETAKIIHSCFFPKHKNS